MSILITACFPNSNCQDFPHLDRQILSAAIYISHEDSTEQTTQMIERCWCVTTEDVGTCLEQELLHVFHGSMASAIFNKTTMIRGDISGNCERLW
jgi:hypothetical protein